MQRIKNLMIIIITILILISSELVMAAYQLDELNDPNNVTWQRTNTMKLSTADDYYFYSDGSASRSNWINNQTFDPKGSTNIEFIFRIYRNNPAGGDKLYIGFSRANLSDATYMDKRLYLYPASNNIYIEVANYSNWYGQNTTTYRTDNPSKIHDYFIGYYPNGAYGKWAVGYRNVTAYNDAYDTTGFAYFFNETLNSTDGGYWEMLPIVFMSGVSGSNTARFYGLYYDDGIRYIKNMTINDSITREILNVSSITFNGNTYRTTNGTFQIDFGTLAASNQIYNNVIVDSSDFGGYHTRVYNGVNFSSGAYTEFNLSSIDVHFLVFDPFNASMQPYEVTYNTTNASSSLSTGISLNLTHRYDTYDFVFSTNGHSFRTTPYAHNFGANYTGSEWITLNPVYCHQYAHDSFSSQAINTFSVNVFGTAWFTTNGTCIEAFENWNECTDTKYNVIVDSPLRGGYFTKVFNGVNINNYNLPMENVRIQMIGSNALDQSTIPAITCQVNATTINSDSSTCYMNFSQGVASLSISAAGGYNTSTDIFATTGNTTYYRNVTLAKTMNFLIKREYDQTCFPFSTNDNMSMVVYCAGASQQFNVTQCDHNFTIGCSFDSILLSHTNGTFSYFRSLIPAYNDSIVTWYMLDLNKDVGVQVIINLLDFSGQYNSGVIRLKRFFGTNIAEIIEQNFDIDTSVNLYLLKHARYSVEICNEAGSCVSLGEIIGDVAEEKTLTIPSIGFYPEESLLGSNITWQMNWTPNSRIYFNYNDTTHGTTMIEWLVYNGSNTSQLYYNNTIMTYDLYASYIIPAAYVNSTFLACFVAYQPTLGIIKDCSAFYDMGVPFGSWGGFTTQEINKTKFWGALIFLFVLMFLFSPFSINAGLVTTCFFLWLFIKFNWLLTGNPMTDYIILFIVCGISGYYIIGTSTKTGAGGGA